MRLYWVFATFLLGPLLALVSLWAALSGRLPREGLAERLGRGAPPVAARAGRLWVHAASLGELASIRPWVTAWAAEGRVMILTCNSAAGRAEAARWGLAGLDVRLAPIDAPFALRPFCRAWAPGALLLVESELWPGRIAALKGAPIIVMGARLSARAARRWRRFAPRLLRAMLARVTFLSAQDAASAARFRAAGLPPAAEGPPLMLKAAAAWAAATALEAAPLPQAPGAFPARARCFLMASTHPGEDLALLDAYLAGGAAGFDLLILAPRHPARGAALAAALRARGVAFAQAAKGEAPGPGTAVFLADTLGEMARWYRAASVTLVGGSFYPEGQARGGHTPYEPAAFGSALLHGPDVANFAAPYDALGAAKAALALAAPEDLGAALATLTPARQKALAKAAARVLAPDGKAEAALAEALAAHLPGPKPDKKRKLLHSSGKKRANVRDLPEGVVKGGTQGAKRPQGRAEMTKLSRFFTAEGEPLPGAQQYGALCWRAGPEGPEILLVTSRETGRWVIPKGWPIKDKGAAESAAREAFEEAGVRGEIAPLPLGHYVYDKVLERRKKAANRALPCEVAVFPLAVQETLGKFPEKDERRRKWFAPEVAAQKVEEPELKRLILAFQPPTLAGNGPKA